MTVLTLIVCYYHGRQRSQARPPVGATSLSGSLPVCLIFLGKQDFGRKPGVFVPGLEPHQAFLQADLWRKAKKLRCFAAVGTEPHHVAWSWRSILAFDAIAANSGSDELGQGVDRSLRPASEIDRRASGLFGGCRKQDSA